MPIRFLWPGKTKNEGVRALLDFYEGRIRRLAGCRIVETREARGLPEKESARILDAEARGLESGLSGDYIVCLIDGGREMTSEQFSRFLAERLAAARPLAFVVGGFLGLADRLLDRADLRLSLSRMTLSHELARAVLLEQVYRGLTIAKGLRYAK